MSKRHYSLVCAAIFSLSADLFAWRGIDVANASAETPVLNYPLNDNQQGYARESYLIWKPYEDDIDYADHTTRENLSTTSIVFTDKFKHPKFKWSSGVRLAVGKYLPSHDQWDISLIGTYFYNKAESHTKADRFNGESIANLWNQSFLSSAIESSASLQLNYFTTDILLGRYFSLTQHLQLHPFIGARGGFIFQDYGVKTQTPIVGFERLRFGCDHNFVGAGPRIGTDLAYSFGHGWSFLGSLSASFLYGRYTLREKIKGIAQTPRNTPLIFKIKDADTMLRSNLEGSIGLQWEKWVRAHTVRIAPSFQVEFSEWFALKRWVDTHTPSNRIPTATDLNLQSRRRYGDLGLFGFNVNLHVDF